MKLKKEKKKRKKTIDLTTTGSDGRLEPQGSESRIETRTTGCESITSGLIEQLYHSAIAGRVVGENLTTYLHTYIPPQVMTLQHQFLTDIK